jgi:hypothetical protein
MWYSKAGGVDAEIIALTIVVCADGTRHLIPCDVYGCTEDGHRLSLECPCGPEDGDIVTHFCIKKKG